MGIERLSVQKCEACFEVSSLQRLHVSIIAWQMLCVHMLLVDTPVCRDGVDACTSQKGSRLIHLYISFHFVYYYL